jgi:hypothetical protein
MLRPTQSVDLRDPTPTSIILSDGTAATIRQPVPGHLIISKERFEIASASIVNGQAVNLKVHGDYTGLCLGDLIRRSAKRSYGGGQ